MEEKTVTQFFDFSQYRDFARPEFCQQLCRLGVTADMPYKWKVSSEKIILHTSVFDCDDYYTDSVKHVDAINNYVATPAYSLADFIVFLTAVKFSYNVIFRDEKFHVFPNNSEVVSLCPPVTAPRLPDAMARMIMNMIVGGLVDIQALNNFLQVKILSQST